MPVILFLAAAAVLGGVILVALGRGGEMAGFPPDYAPLALDRVSATDVALLQPPKALWGYHPQVTEEALQAIARAVSERDVEIERLRHQVAELRSAAGPASPSAPRDAAPGGAAPASAAPGGAAPGGAVPGEITPGDAAPGDAAPGDAAPGGAAPGGAVPGEITPGDAPPGDAAPGDAAPGDAAPGDAAPGDAAPRDTAVAADRRAAAEEPSRDG